MKLLLIHTKCMALIGLWSNHRNAYGKAHTLLVLLIQFINLISVSTNLIQCNGKLNCSFENLTYSILTASSIYMMIVFLVHESAYHDAWNALNALMEKFKTHKYSVRAEIITRRVTVFCIGYSSIGLLHYNVVPIFDYDNCRKRNSSDSALTCGLPTTGNFPFKTTENPGYGVAYIFQVISAILCIQSVTQPCMLSASIIYHTIGHLYMIQDDLESLLNHNENENNSGNKLKKIIKHHSAIIEFSKLISEAVNQMLFMYIVMLAVIFSVSGFQVLSMVVTEIELWIMQRYLIIFFGYGLLCWCFSFLGQKLIDESTRIATCAYNTEWYAENLQFQNMIKFIIIRSNKPLLIKSASISNVSFASFTKVVSTTYSYLAMMYKVMILNDLNNKERL